jgi:hypothetical protein
MIPLPAKQISQECPFKSLLHLVQALEINKIFTISDINTYSQRHKDIDIETDRYTDTGTGIGTDLELDNLF